jgi:hypothetical protein
MTTGGDASGSCSMTDSVISGVDLRVLLLYSILMAYTYKQFNEDKEHNRRLVK